MAARPSPFLVIITHTHHPLALSRPRTRSYAIIGMNLFGLVRDGEELGLHVGFDTFPLSFLTLFRCAAGGLTGGMCGACVWERMPWGASGSLAADALGADASSYSLHYPSSHLRMPPFPHPQDYDG